MRQRVFIGFILIFVWNICVLAQNKELKTEEDGFKWYLTSSDGNRGAQSVNGKELVPLSIGFEWVSYHNGFLIGTIFSPDDDFKKNKNACYDKTGKVIIPFGRYEHISYNVPEAGKPAWFSVTKNGFDGACDVTGKEIIPPVYTGLLYGSKGFEGKKENGNYNLLGISLPGHDIMAFVEKRQKTESDGFVWYELRDYPNYGAADKDGKLLIPMSMQLTRVKYLPSTVSGKYGVFEVYKEDFVGVYNSQGFEILSPNKGYTYWKYIGNSENGYLRVDKGNMEYGFCDLNQNEIIAPGKYSYVSFNKNGFFEVKQGDYDGICDLNGNEIIAPGKYSSVYFNANGFFEVKQGDYEGICNLNGNEIIAPNKYTSISYNNYENEPEWFSVEKDGKEGAYDMYGRELVPALYSELDYDNEDGFYYEDNGNYIALNVIITSNDSNIASNGNTSTNSSSSSYSYSSFAPPSSSSYSSNTNSKYVALSDPNLVDNSEKIANAQKLINDLESQKQNCYTCHGTGAISQLCTWCNGTGTTKVGYYTPQYFTCSWCRGTGRKKQQCVTCAQTDMKISLTQSLLKTLQETHGMTKEVLNTYTEIKAWEHNQNMEYQKAIDEIAEPYLNSTRKSNSSHSSTSSSSKCSMCNGTGIDPHVYHSGDPKPAVGGYTHSSGGKCIYCGKYEWHQHVYCPKCNANKYP